MSIKINTKPVASRYGVAGEKIIEYSCPSGGGLISFREDGDGKLIVELYRHDETVEIRLPHGEGAVS